MLKLVKIACAAFASALLLMASPASAGSIDIYVGYADNLRANPFFPTPWIGDPGVVSETPGSETFDAGAIRIDNNTGSAITIHNLVVTLNGGANVFSFWLDLVIGAGQIGIFTQTSSYNFDTSDFQFLPAGIGIDAAHPLGGCTNPGALSPTQVAMCTARAPTVSFDVVELASSFGGTDTGHILDTFGYDFNCCTSDGNESINWNLIGSNPTRGGTAPEPATALLLATSLIAAGFMRRRQKRA
jgi:hypothetical protein